MAKKMTKQEQSTCETVKIQNLTPEVMFRNFTIGEIVSYKEICKRLKVEEFKGNQKKTQFKELERYMELDKIKSKFLITDIYNERQPIDPRPVAANALYVKYIECILLQYLTSVPGNNTYITKNNLWNLLGITNKKYHHYRNKTELLTQMNPIMTYFEINNFYQRSWSYFSKIVDRSLDSLDRRALIAYEKNVYMIIECPRDNDNIELHRRASVNEIEEILKVQRKTLLLFGLHDKKQVQFLDLKKKKKYYDTIDNELNDKFGWKGVYTAYHIIYNRENAKEALSQDKIELEKLALNEIVINKLNDQAERLYEKSIDVAIINYCDDKQLGFVYPEWYAEVQREISETLLRIEDKRKQEYQEEKILIPDFVVEE